MSDFSTYLVEYQFQNETWSAEIKASSRDEAERRLKAMQHGEVLGEVQLKLQAPRLRWLRWLFTFK